MREPITLSIPGLPIPQRATKFRRRRGWFQPFPDPRTEAWKEVVARYSLAARPAFAARVPLELTAVFSLPGRGRKDALRPHVLRPDLDNLAKALPDAQKRILFADDAQIIRLVLEKRFSIEPGVEVEIREASGA